LPLLPPLFALLRGEFLGQFVRVQGALVRLLAKFMGSQVIFFAMGDRRHGMRVGRKIVEFRCAFVVPL
jgi:hypothetical protein